MWHLNTIFICHSADYENCSFGYQEAAAFGDHNLSYPQGMRDIKADECIYRG